MDENEELKFLRKFTKKKSVWGSWSDRVGGVRVGVRVDVNEELKFL